MPAPPRSSWGSPPGAGAVVGSAVPTASPLAAIDRTSALVIRPPGPLPVTDARSMPSAAAMRAATGDTFAPSGGGAAGASAGPPFVVSGAEGSVSRVGAAPSVAVVMRAMTSPTVTVAPASTRTSVIVPAVGAGSSTSTLSVEISAIVWPSSTASPGATCHSSSVPSVTDSPAVGVTMSTVRPSAGASVAWPLPRASEVGLGAGRRVVAVARRGGAVAGRDLGQDGAHLNGVAFGCVDLGHRPCGRSRHLGVHLVGRDLDENLVRLDPVALLLVPLQDGALGHRLTHRGQSDLHCCVDRHLSCV